MGFGTEEDRLVAEEAGVAGDGRSGDVDGEPARDGIADASIGDGRGLSASVATLPSIPRPSDFALCILGLKVDVSCGLRLCSPDTPRSGDHTTPLLCSPALTMALVKSIAVKGLSAKSGPTSRSRQPLRIRTFNLAVLRLMASPTPRRTRFGTMLVYRLPME